MVAAGKVYPRAGMAFAGSVNRNVREYLSLHGDMLEFTDLHSLDLEAITRVIMVDTRSADRVGELEPVVRRKDVEVFVIDHHPRARGDLKGTRDLSEAQGATTTILVKLPAQAGDTHHPLRGHPLRPGHPRGHRLPHLRRHHPRGRRGAGLADGRGGQPRRHLPLPAPGALALPARPAQPAAGLLPLPRRQGHPGGDGLGGAGGVRGRGLGGGLARGGTGEPGRLLRPGPHG